jgi:uncharacterized protein
LSIYCDTSLLVAGLVNEPRTVDVQQWLEKQPAGSLFISDWSVTEFSSALSVKVREKKLTLEDRAKALAKWTTLREESLVVLSVMAEHFTIAAIYAERANLGLRAGDALHLAIAAANGCGLATLDSKQRKAAVELGIPCKRL